MAPVRLFSLVSCHAVCNQRKINRFITTGKVKSKYKIWIRVTQFNFVVVINSPIIVLINVAQITGPGIGLDNLPFGACMRQDFTGVLKYTVCFPAPEETNRMTCLGPVKFG